MLENYKDCLFNYEVILKSQQRFKRLQTFDWTKTYPYGTNAFRMCEREMMLVRNLFVENYADFHFIMKWFYNDKIRD